MNEPHWRWLWRGSRPAEATFVELDESIPVLPEALCEKMTVHWRESRRAADADGITLFESPLAQLRGFAAGAGELRLTLGRSSYKHWLYSSGRQDEIEERFGAQTASRPLALCAAVISSDDRVVIQQRSGRVAEGEGLLHVVGGHLDPDQHRKDGLPDPRTAMLCELKEELGLDPDELSGGLLLGLGENTANGKPELLYRFKTELDSESLKLRAASAQDRFEFSDLLFWPSEGEALGAEIAGAAIGFAAPGLALLGLLAERRDG